MQKKQKVKLYNNKQVTTLVHKELNEFLFVSSRVGGEGFVVTHKPTGTVVLPVYFESLQDAEKFGEFLLSKDWDWSKLSKEEIVGGINNLESFYTETGETLKNISHATY